MQSKAQSVDEYLQEVPEKRQAALSRLRKLCQKILVGYEESMAYGMPSYKQQDGDVEVAFASQKNYISLYILKEEVLNKHRESLADLSLGKGCIRYRRPQQINFTIVEQLLSDSFQSSSDIC